MKVLNIYNQSRRDCHADLECEGCGNKETDTSAYDDRCFWDNVIPSMECKKCGKSTNSMNIEPEKIATRYPEGKQA